MNRRNKAFRVLVISSNLLFFFSITGFLSVVFESKLLCNTFIIKESIVMLCLSLVILEAIVVVLAENSFSTPTLAHLL